MKQMIMAESWKAHVTLSVSPLGDGEQLFCCYWDQTRCQPFWVKEDRKQSTMADSGLNDLWWPLSDAEWKPEKCPGPMRHVNIAAETKPQADREREKDAETDACCPRQVFLFVSVGHVSILLLSSLHFIHYSQLCTGWKRGGVVIVEPEGGRGERDTTLNRPTERCVESDTLLCRVSVCVCVCGWEPGVQTEVSQYASAAPVEHICWNLWYWHVQVHLTETCLHATVGGNEREGGAPKGSQ